MAAKKTPKKSKATVKPKPKGAAPKKKVPLKSTKKNKGSTEYQKIKKYLLDRYKKRTNIESNKDAGITAKAVHQHLKIEGKLKGKATVTHKLLKEALNFLFPQPQRRWGRLLVPDIPDRLQIPTEFWKAEEIITEMNRGTFRRVWIYSPLILGKKNNGYRFLSPDKKYTYADTFQGWVDYINEQILDGYYKDGSPPDVFYRFLEVFRNTRRKRWEVRIIPCDSDGNSLNTGYIPSESDDSDHTEERYGVNPKEEELKKELLRKETEEFIAQLEADEALEKKQPKEKEQPSQSREVIDAQLKSEEEKQKTYRIQTLVQAKQSVMEDIKFNKEIGEDYADLMIKLKSIRDQIDKLI